MISVSVKVKSHSMKHFMYPATPTWLQFLWGNVRVWTKLHARRIIFGHVVRKLKRGMNTPLLQRILSAQPDVADKPIRPYLTRRLRASARAEAILTHYQTAEERLSPAAVEQIHLSTVTLLHLNTERGVVTISLGAAAGFHREAEWRLTLSFDGAPTAAMGLAIVKPRHLGLEGETPCLWIGIMKGLSKGEGLERARSATKALRGLRPKGALLLAAQEIANALRLENIYATSNEGHVFAGYKGLRRRILADYDQFWEESQGERLSRFVFRLPRMKPVRNLSAYPANKRSQIRSRQALEAEVIAALSEALRGLTTPEQHQEQDVILAVVPRLVAPGM